MGFIKTVAKLGMGLVAGGAIGAAISAKTAPEDPNSKRYKIRQHFRDAKQAGDEAKAIRQAELISRYRKDVGDHDALEEEVDHSLSPTDAVLAMGLSLNAPGVIASTQALDRDPDD